MTPKHPLTSAVVDAHPLTLSAPPTDEQVRAWALRDESLIDLCEKLEERAGEIAEYAERLRAALVKINEGGFIGAAIIARAALAENPAPDELCNGEAPKATAATPPEAGAGPYCCTMTGNLCGSDTVRDGTSCPDERNRYRCIYPRNAPQTRNGVVHVSKEADRG